GTAAGAAADADGNYTIHVKPGNYKLLTSSIGYTSVTLSVAVKAGETVTQDFRLEQDVLKMQEVVVTGSGGLPTSKSHLGNAIGLISSAEMENIPMKSVTQLLNARTTGVQIWSSSGLLGTTSLIQLRGIGSLTGNTSPLIYVDGVRISNTNTFSVSQNTDFKSIDKKDQQAISTLNLINPDDIDRVEILKGASAATLYGSDAANGVIQIFTKSGTGISKGNPFQYQYSFGSISQDWSIYNKKFTKAAEQFVREGSGIGWQHQFNATGAGERYHFYGSVSWRDENAGFKQSNQKDFDIKGNFTYLLDDVSDLKVGASYTRDYVTRPDADNAGQANSGFFSQLMKIDTVDMQTRYTNPYSKILFYENSLYDKLHNEYTNKRYSGNINYTRKLPYGLNLGVNLGYEDLAMDQLRWIEYGFVNPATGQRSTETRGVDSYNGQVTLSGKYIYSDDFGLGASAGLEYYRTHTNLVGTVSSLFDPGFDGDIQFGSQTTYQLQELATTFATGAAFLQTQLEMFSRAFLTLGIRADKSSSFGNEASARLYPKASLSYILPIDNTIPYLALAKLRGSFGQAGNQPSPGAADLTLRRESNLVGSSGVIILRPGDAALQPSRTTEFELGFDLAFFDGNLGTEVTYYNQKVKDDLFSVRTKPSEGYGGREQTYNLGQIETTGWEISVFGTPFKSESISWYSRVNVSTVTNKVIDDGGYAFNAGPFQSLQYLRVEAGHAVGEFNYPRLDINKYGSATTGLVSVYRGGQVTPKLTGNWVNDFTVMKNLSLSVNVGWAFGFKVLNLTRANLHRNGIFDDDFTKADMDSGLAISKIAETQRTAAQIEMLTKYNMQTNTNSDVFLEDGDFVKIREISINYRVPGKYFGSLGITGLNLSLSALNVATFTGYKGFDPEVSVGGSILLARGADNRSVPSPRTFVFKAAFQF
ncbi:MAG: TonB-dependent receptor plug domain-containing protein, partial [Syntrophothermus sp.]